jgi:hypothetical protein
MVVAAPKTDILRCVVDLDLESVAVSIDDAASPLARQACLAKLVLVSQVSDCGSSKVADDQVFEEICTPRLYEDCLVSDVNEFLCGP